MSTNDQGLDELSELWRATDDEPPAVWLRRMVAARRRRLTLTAIGEWALVVTFVALSVVVVRWGIELWSAVWLATLWTFTVVAVLFSWWNRRGLWRALGDDVEAYVHLARLRAMRQLRAARFGVGLLFLEVAAVAAQLAWFQRLSLATALILAIFATVILACCAWAARQARRELAVLDDYDR